MRTLSLNNYIYSTDSLYHGLVSLLIREFTQELHVLILTTFLYATTYISLCINSF